ncbi:hypothetical protein IMG5_181520 [Ichthyophthirius multifiliis]|uniref:SAC domain-containing protein n=1 Tax=Ichthyophthirius multifiliis TaxID=5932 RepID=G0R2V1_ICHMU|nr:hypothetical protein IMG5_181520 [Ichthyophthirius multifiliis]EGR28223.1 hypothetical protein IMG5_181520 [Ichthyophthirius multifiliis]|eukprot:XP_004027568.1 hypothetical protein IMG5_181520 [Ichthyophthirius multifiliis]
MTDNNPFIKIIVVGEQNVGKTCILARYSRGQFDNSCPPTLGMDFSSKLLEYNGNTIRLQLWDIAGQERYTSVSKLYVRGAYGALVVADITNENSLYETLKWKKIIEESCDYLNNKPIPMFLVQNKLDEVKGLGILQEYQKESFLKTWSKENGFSGCLQVSAKDNTNIPDIFQMLIELIIKEGYLKKDEQNQGFKALYGVCELKKSKYLILATESTILGSIYNKNIQKISKMEFFGINPRKEQIHKEDQYYIQMMQSLFKTKTFYFSDEYDLTQSFQRFVKNQIDKNKYNLNYCYNECFLHDFIKIGADEWITPFISGYLKIEYCQINESQIEFILISRRDKRRAGMRFISRGTDLDGNPSNMAETEQITVISQGDQYTIYSFVQTRGSMPFYWSQKTQLTYTPKSKIIGDENSNKEFCRKHFNDQQKYYNKQVLVNLIDKKGKVQLPLGIYFQNLVNKLNDKNLKYIWFDFHHKCRKMKYENLIELINEIKPDLDEMGYYEFQYTKDKINNPTIKKLQSGVVRTNCMDCLDRTNVVQSVIGRTILHQILYNAQINQKQSTAAFEKFSEKLEQKFRNTWTENADIMSILYTGTGALKTDFTRLGKRTINGAIQDGKNSIMRYIYGNFFDGHKQVKFFLDLFNFNFYFIFQDCIDLLLGKLHPKEKNFGPKLNPLIYIILILIFGPLIVKPYVNMLFFRDNQSQFINYATYFYLVAAFLWLIKKLPQIFVQQSILDQ